MSYSAIISFKNLKPNEVYDFLQYFKNKTTDRIDQIATDSPSFSPMMKAWRGQENLEITDQMREDTKRWANESIFKYRYFYDPDRNLLAVYGIPTCMRDVFDLTFEFQDSCDQDYDFDCWKGVPSFEKVASKWQAMPKDMFLKLMRAKFEADGDTLNDRYKTDEKIEYYRKSYCYNEIWNTLEWSLYHDNKVLYLSLFGYYDFLPMQKFVNATEKAVLAQIREWTSKNNPKPETP